MQIWDNQLSFSAIQVYLQWTHTERCNAEQEVSVFIYIVDTNRSHNKETLYGKCVYQECKRRSISAIDCMYKPCFAIETTTYCL